MRTSLDCGRCGETWSSEVDLGLTDAEWTERHACGVTPEAPHTEPSDALRAHAMRAYDWEILKGEIPWTEYRRARLAAPGFYRGDPRGRAYNNHDRIPKSARLLVDIRWSLGWVGFHARV